MSNPTELPDLDRLLDRAERIADWFANASMRHSAADVRSLIALARRAQPEGEDRCVICGSTEPRTGTCGSDDPRALCKGSGKPEGEAPQAEPLNGRIAGAHACFSEHMPPGSLTSIGHAHVYKALQAAISHYVAHQPAAQHAESGAPAMTDELRRQVIQDTNDTLREQAATMLTQRKKIQALEAALAAQQAAAPGALAEARELLKTARDDCGLGSELGGKVDDFLERSASAPGTPEAPKELGLDIAVAVNQKIGKYIAANKPALMLLNEDELAALYRFQETCEDSDSGGYDVDKEMMKRLAAIGVIESKGFGRYQFTEFGDFVVERAAQLDGGQEGSGS